MAFPKWELCNSQHGISGFIPCWRLWSEFTALSGVGVFVYVGTFFTFGFWASGPDFPHLQVLSSSWHQCKQHQELLCRMVDWCALAWCLRHYPGVGPWWAEHHRRKVSTNVSQTSDTQGILCLDGNCRGDGRWGPYPVQLFCEWSIELSHNTALGCTPGALSPARVLRRDEWAEHTTVVQNFPCRSFRNHWNLPPLHPHAMEQADEKRMWHSQEYCGVWFGTSLLVQMSTRVQEQQALMVWCLWLVLPSYWVRGEPFSDAFPQSVTAPHSSDGQQPARSWVILAV